MVKLQNVCKKFNNISVVNNISATIGQKSCTAILGESGAGKTTIIRMIGGLDLPTSGQIIIDGDILSEKSIKNIRFKVGFLFQNFNLFPHLTALENICFAPIKVLKWEKNFALEKARALLQKFKLQTAENKYSSQLSGGQKQRVALIRALMMNPKIILLDEPTSALDPTMVNEVGEMIDFLKQSGTTVIMVTHHIKFVEKYATNVLFCFKGATSSLAVNDFFTSNDPNIRSYLQHNLT